LPNRSRPNSPCQRASCSSVSRRTPAQNSFQSGGPWLPRMKSRPAGRGFGRAAVKREPRSVRPVRATPTRPRVSRDRFARLPGVYQWCTRGVFEVYQGAFGGVRRVSRNLPRPSHRPDDDCLFANRINEVTSHDGVLHDKTNIPIRAAAAIYCPVGRLGSKLIRGRHPAPDNSRDRFRPLRISTDQDVKLRFARSLGPECTRPLSC